MLLGPSDVKLLNLKATGRDRKILHLYDLADSVWGDKTWVAAKKPIDTKKILSLTKTFTFTHSILKSVQCAMTPVGKIFISMSKETKKN